MRLTSIIRRMKVNNIRQANIIANHYVNMYNLASSIKYTIECMDNNEPSILDRNQLCEYIIYCTSKIKEQHLKDFGIKLEIENRCKHGVILAENQENKNI